MLNRRNARLMIVRNRTAERRIANSIPQRGNSAFLTGQVGPLKHNSRARRCRVKCHRDPLARMKPDTGATDSVFERMLTCWTCTGQSDGIHAGPHFPQARAAQYFSEA